MPEVYARESRSYTRDRESSGSDDEYKRTTVRRYKVAPNRVERVEREVDVIEEDRRSRYAPPGFNPRSSDRDLLAVERTYVPERPRSAFDPGSPRDRDGRDERYTRDRFEFDIHRGGAVVERERERVVEREERDGYPERSSRTLVIERDEDHHHHDRDRDRGRAVVYEAAKEEARSPRDWERRAYWDDKDTEVRVEKRVERRDDGTEVRIERRYEERDDSVERWRKQTEYYEPVPAPIVIRPREQKIIVQEPAPVVIREQQESRDLVVGRRDDDYYYRRDVRELAPYGTEIRREEEVEVVRYEDPPHHHHHRRHHHHHRHHDGGASDDEYYYRKKTVVREGSRSSSGSPHRKRHIAEGALAGAGLSAIIASRRGKDGELPEKRGRKVLAGAALGALGTEAVRRAHSAYEERFGDEDRERSRSREREKHSRIKTGLGIAAVALAAAGAAKYYQSNKIEKEELGRGRPLRRYSDDESSRSPSRKRSKSRAASLAKAAAGTAAVAGIVQHIRKKRSKSRDGKSRSRSRLRTGAEIVAAGLAGAGAKKLYDKRKEKKERSLSRSSVGSRGLSEEEYYSDDSRRDRRRHRSRSRDVPRSGPTYPDAAGSSIADPELGMVEYGTQPLYDPRYPEHGVDAYDSAAEEARIRRRKRDHRHRSRSRGGSGAGSDSETDTKKPEKKRSKSRLRDIATGAAAVGAAAIGIKKFNDKKEKDKEREKDTDSRKDRDRARGSDRDLDRPKDRDRATERARDALRDRERERQRE